MSTADVTSLANLVEALSVDALDLQLRFDDEHDWDLARLGDALAAVTDALGSAAAASFPAWHHRGRIWERCGRTSRQRSDAVAAPVKIGVKLVPSSRLTADSPVLYQAGPGTKANRPSRPGVVRAVRGEASMRMGFVSPAISDLTSRHAALKRSLP